MGAPRYKGRFAPSPTGALHAGSLVAALASWLDARACGGQWLVRIEDVDRPRCVPGMGNTILQQLAALGLVPDAVPIWQLQRQTAYQAALDQLIATGLAYPCRCSRKAVAAALQARGIATQRQGELVYPGTCRPPVASAPAADAAAAWRLRTDLQLPAAAQPAASGLFVQQQAAFAIARQVESGSHSTARASGTVTWQDRRLGLQRQQVESTVGDFPLKRADGCYTYQLAVVVDDAFQGITHVVRGEDLADNTARQILLQRALGLSTPRYLHTPLVLGASGEKLSKQNGAVPLDLTEPTQALTAAAQALGLDAHAGMAAGAGAVTADGARLLAAWVQQWRALYNPEREHHLD